MIFGSKPLCFAILLAALAACATGQPVQAKPAATQPTSQPAPIVRSALIPAMPYVLIVSIDGLRPDCMLRADTPTLLGLMKQGSFSLWARTTDVAITTPSHVSMLTGVVPETHGINFNGDPPDDAQIKVPTLFDLAHAHGLSTGLVSGKRKFTLFGHSGAVDQMWVTEKSVGPDAEVATQAAKIIKEFKPRVMFVHFPGADSVGHGKGWGTPEQLERIGVIDKAFSEVLKAYDEAGLTGQRYVIVSADHGGTMRSHGRDDMRSRYIPWIVTGPGIRENYDLTRLGKTYEIATYDTFATACLLLDIPQQPGIDGKPILPIFQDFDLLAGAPATIPAR